MIEKDEILALLSEVVGKSPADATELVAYGQDSSLTRFANSVIHQNVHEDDHVVIARVAVGKRVGVTETNRIDGEGLTAAIERAMAIARESPEQKDFAGLPKADPAAEVPAYSEETARVSPATRATAVALAAEIGAEKSVVVSGAYRTSVLSLAVANSRGTTQYYDATEAFFSVFATDRSGVSGSMCAYAVSHNDIDVERVARTAVDKCVAARDPVEIEPGPIDVILEPEATAEIMEWLSYTAFGARQVQEGQSFMAGRIGERVMGENITIYDDGLDSAGIPVPFDWEGVPKRRVVLVDAGTAKGPVYDTATAAKDGVESTGHAGPATFRSGPSPSNLFVAPGDDSLDGLIARVGRGLLVTRFHYVNGLLDTKKALMTGMTRDGTFLIEDGKIGRAVKNLRFTESMLRAYSNVDGITRERRTFGGNWGGIGSVTVPTMLVRDFTFTGATEF